MCVRLIFFAHNENREEAEWELKLFNYSRQAFIEFVVVVVLVFYVSCSMCVLCACEGINGYTWLYFPAALFEI